MHAADSSTSPKTWGEALRRYREEQRFAVAEPGTPLNRSRGPNDRTRLNPVLQKYDDDELEVTRRTEEDHMRATERTNALKSSNRYGTPYNITNWTTVRPLTVTEVEPPREVFLSDSRVQYNILNMNPRLEFISDQKIDDDAAKKSGKRVIKVPNFGSTEYDVLSNVFHENHEQKDQQERRLFTESVDRKMQQSRRMDPILGVHGNRDQEEKYSREQERIVEVQKMLRDSHLPSYMRQSLGRCYDITRHVVTDEKGFSEWCWKFVESKKYHRLFDEDEFKKRLDETQQKDDTRTLHRVSHQRYTEGVTRGYNIVSNEELEANELSPYNTTNSHLVSTVRQLSPWEKCLAEGTDVSAEPMPTASSPKTEIVSRFPPIHS